jgi:thioredoxin reductase (NADPH)
MAEEEVMMMLGGDMDYPPEPVRTSPYEFDFFVIGGGSGGLAASKEAASLGAKTGLADFVKPTPHGTVWGLGGTCVNVGCIPKKLMHFAASFGEYHKDEIACGWELPEHKPHNWQRMVANVQKHIKSLNWGYKMALLDKQVEYFNNYAVFVDSHTVALLNGAGDETRRVTSEHFLVAVGGRPTLNIPGSDTCTFSSDDLFSLKSVPDQILVVGASYIALECAGFLKAMGRQVDVMVRSIFLRGFDQEMADKAAEHLGHLGVNYVRDSEPTLFERNADGKVVVTYRQQGETKTAVYEGVLMAIGRYAVTDGIHLENAGVVVNTKNGKVITDDLDCSNVPNVWSVGDCADNRPELTPSAIQSGVLLAKRLFGGSVLKMDYVNVPTTVFTPLEYAAVGLSEERAYEVHGQDNVEVYMSVFKPLEWNFLPERRDLTCYCKVICLKPKNEQIIGMHFIGPHAGEVMQGYAVAVKAGATKFDLDMTVGIHPTCAEEFTTLTVTRASGANAEKTGC